MNALTWVPPDTSTLLIAARVPFDFELRVYRGEFQHTVLLYREQGLTPDEIRTLVHQTKGRVLFVTSSPILIDAFVQEAGYDCVYAMTLDGEVFPLLSEFAEDFLVHFRLGDLYACGDIL